jgi:hypothetical protein
MIGLSLGLLIALTILTGILSIEMFHNHTRGIPSVKNINRIICYILFAVNGSGTILIYLNYF